MNQRIKLLVFTSVPRSGDRMAGGVQTVSYNFLKSISTYKEFEVSVIDCFGDDQEDLYLRDNNIDYYYVTSPKPKIFSRIIREIPKLKKLIVKINPDIIHAHTTSTAYIALQTGKPTLLTPHSSVLESMKNRSGLINKLNSVLYAYLEHNSLKKIRHIIQISPYIKKVFEMRTKASFYPVDNPIGFNFFDSNPDSQREDYILFIGKVDSWKSPLHILKAYNSISHDFPTVQIKIVGPFNDERYLKNMQEYCRLNSLNRVEFTGPKSGNEIISLCRNCMFLVLPSRQETAPMVIAEAMACGKPVIASNVSGNPWMVTEGKTGFLYDYGDIEQLAEKMSNILSDASLRIKLGRTAREVAYDRFHPDEVVKKTVGIYKNILLEGK